MNDGYIAIVHAQSVEPVIGLTRSCNGFLDWIGGDYEILNVPFSRLAKEKNHNVSKLRI